MLYDITITGNGVGGSVIKPVVEIFEGNTTTLNFTIRERSTIPGQYGPALSLSGATITLYIKGNVIETTSTQTVVATVTSAVNGQCSVTLAAIDTPGNYSAELRYVGTLGTITLQTFHLRVNEVAG